MSDYIGYESVELQKLPTIRSSQQSKRHSKNSPVSDVIYLGSFRKVPKLVLLEDSDTDVTKDEVIIDTARQSYVRITQKRSMANERNETKNASSRRRSRRRTTTSNV